MRKILCFIASSVCVNIAMAIPTDTIDYWHVYYNGVKIGDFNHLSSVRTITFEIDSINTADSITVRYYRDTPCFYCSTTLVAENQENLKVSTSVGKGTFAPISFYLKSFVEYRRNNKNSLFEIFYIEENRPERILLFMIRIE